MGKDSSRGLGGYTTHLGAQKQLQPRRTELAVGSQISFCSANTVSAMGRIADYLSSRVLGSFALDATSELQFKMSGGQDLALQRFHGFFFGGSNCNGFPTRRGEDC